MSIKRWIDKDDVVKIHNGILPNHKKNEMPFVATQMYLEIIILGKSEGERQMSYNVAYMWNLKYEANELIWNRNRITDRQQTCGCLQGDRSGMVWESGIGRYKLWHVKQMNNKVLCIAQGTRFNMINHNGKECEKESIRMHDSIILLYSRN